MMPTKPPLRMLSFDCFGTLIDWERGQARVLAALPSLCGYEDRIPAILESRVRHEGDLERGPFRPYELILGESLRLAVEEVCALHLTPTEVRAFAAGQLGWPAWPEVPESLARLAAVFPIALLSNCDDQMLRLCAHKHLGVPVAAFVSSEGLRSYKPGPAHWEELLRLSGEPAAAILHVSFSPDYDLETAARWGFSTALLRRYGIEPAAEEERRHRFVVNSLAELAEVLLVEASA